ncbi:twin-arginine translocase subunit TatB [Rhodobacteraceae bacterium 2CG4]|uniref:Sec-independent protein translocase protein TatB n=1 Tax=Halovulum marinum TaxID=2662447 RepID=A0A6L5YX89_9RHOB|nr:Sec-independent protein translocase protein TatB [Halovulum marinum]MSU88951.1 twin-arginine translocase subunit TatB [Halovulum marinum]
MFDLGWLELIVIGITALIVVGPKDLPGLFRNVGRFMGRMRAMAREFQRSMEQAADESGLKEATKGLNDLHDLHRSPAKSARSYARDMMKGDEPAKPDATAARDAEALEDEVAYAAERDPVPARKAASGSAPAPEPAPAPAPEAAPEPASAGAAPDSADDPLPAAEPRENRES